MFVRLTPALLLLLPLGLFAGTDVPADFRETGSWINTRTRYSLCLTTPSALLTITQQGTVIRLTESGAIRTYHIRWNRE